MGFGKMLLWTLSGVAVGHVAGRLIGETEEEKQRLSANGRLSGGLLGFGVGLATYEPSDTVNYGLKNDNKIVYHGIAKENRLDTRILEHEKSGKKFNAVFYDIPKPESVARIKEFNSIRRSRPKYNVQHNS